MKSLLAEISPILFVLIAAEVSNQISGFDGCLIAQSESDAASALVKQMREEIEEAKCQLLRDVSYSDYSVSNGERVDFIVVGAGSAGAVVASRLSENSLWRVLLLEAGGDPTVSSEVPGLFFTARGSGLDWNYRTEPEATNCLGMIDRRCAWPRGKVIGGSSSINTMLYVRGHPEDYDDWQTSGNDGWSYEHMLPYFKKSEDFRSATDSHSVDALKYHGKGGPLKVESFKNTNDFIVNKLVKGYEELGYAHFTDANAGDYIGLFTVQGTLDNARRCSTGKAFLHPFQTRPNLMISKSSLVTKILVDANNTAYGVQFLKGRELLEVVSSKEVIVSGGTVNPPQLLMLSGIGPKEHLEAFGIDVKKDLKVGRNLQDHAFFKGFVISINDSLGPAKNTLNDMFQFLINSKGRLTSGAFNTLGVIKTGNHSRSNLQMTYAFYSLNSTDLKKELTKIGLADDVQKSYLEINKERSIILMMPSVLRPVSRGRVILNSSSPLEHPLIHPGYFSREEDIVEMLDGIQFANEFAQSKPMREIGARVEYIYIPGCVNFEFQTEGYWRCAIKHMSVSYYHPVGTCRMGPIHDSDTVVISSNLNVKGINSLRVVDASVMPTIVSGNVNAPTIAIAEKASDLIKQTWGTYL